MKPIEILALTPISESLEIYNLIRFMEDNYIYHPDCSNNKLITLKYYVDEPVETSRTFQIYSVWYNNEAVMICNSSADGSYLSHFVINEVAYHQMLKYMLTLTNDESIKIYDLNEDIPNMTSIGGYYNMEDYYVADFVPAYQVGDIVKAKVLKNHLRDAYAGDKAEFVETRCKITSVRLFNPSYTYHLLQLDRRWETSEEVQKRTGTDQPLIKQDVIYDKNNGAIGAKASEAQILGYWK
jgi:hypothetical protein